MNIPISTRNQLPALFFALLPPSSHINGSHGFWRPEKTHRPPNAQRLPGATWRGMCITKRCGRYLKHHLLNHTIPHVGINITSSLMKRKGQPARSEESFGQVWPLLMWKMPQEVQLQTVKTQMTLISLEMMRRKAEA